MKTKYILFIIMLINTITIAQTPNCNVTGLSNTTKAPLTEITDVDPQYNLGGPRDERIVYWIHGLDGDLGSWSKASEASEFKFHDRSDFQARKLQSKRYTYNEEASFLNAASDLRSQINNDVDSGQNPEVNPNLNFIIGHSQGGIVSNALIYKDYCAQPLEEEYRYYGGQVTFGSPHLGAIALNNKDYLIELGANSTSELLAWLDNDLENIGDWEWLTGFNPSDIIDSLHSKMQEFIMPRLFSGVLNGTSEHLMVGSAQLDLFQTCPTPNLNRVAIYSVEDFDGLFLRTMSYLYKNPNSENVWEANYDWDFKDDVIDPLHLKYANKYYENRQKYILIEAISHVPCNWFDWIFNFVNCALYDAKYWKHYKKARAWKKGLDWFSSIDDRYKVGFGALTYSTSQELWCYCEYCDEEDYYTYCEESEMQIQDQSECVENDYETCGTFIRTIITPIEHDSDGIALAESCMAIPNPTFPPVRVDGSSHMQLRNSEQTRLALNNLFRGNYGYFFRTEKRD